jgi:hypothetical protein
VTRNGELHLGRERLEDEAYVVENAIETVKMIVRGQLPPGTHEYL